MFLARLMLRTGWRILVRVVFGIASASRSMVRSAKVSGASATSARSYSCVCICTALNSQRFSASHAWNWCGISGAATHRILNSIRIQRRISMKRHSMSMLSTSKKTRAASLLPTPCRRVYSANATSVCLTYCKMSSLWLCALARAMPAIATMVCAMATPVQCSSTQSRICGSMTACV